MGEHGIIGGNKTLLDLEYDDDLSNLSENICKMNEFLEVL